MLRPPALRRTALVLLISNSMISCAILVEPALVSFSKSSNTVALDHPSDSWYFEVFEKLTRAISKSCYYSTGTKINTVETLLIIYNI